MSKTAIKLLKPFIRAFKFGAYDSTKVRFRWPFNQKLIFSIPNFESKIQIEHKEIEGIPVGIFKPENPISNKHIIYFHGGGFAACSYRMYTHLLTALAEQNQMQLIAVDYRLAPEFPYSSGLDDCFTIYQYFRNLAPDDVIYLGGDSAGGGLVFSSALKAKAENVKLPDKLFAFSPWADLTVSSETFQIKKDYDPLIDQDSAKKWAERYLNGFDATHPFASPVYGDFSGFPPSFIHVGSEEVLLGDSIKLKEQLLKYNVTVNYQEWEGMIHVFQILYPLLDEAKHSLKALKKFLQS